MLGTFVALTAGLISAAPAATSAPVTPTGTQDVAYVTTSVIRSGATGATANDTTRTFRYSPSDGPFTAQWGSTSLSLRLGDASLRLTSTDGVSPIALGIHDTDAVSANPLTVAFSNGGEGCGIDDRAVINLHDLVVDNDQVSRLALTFSINCASSLHTMVGEVLFHEPIDPTLQASPSRLDFGRQDPGSRRDVAVRLTNTGTTPVSVNGLTTQAPFQVIAGTCQSATLAPGSSCDLTVRFNPVAAGTVNGALTVADSSPGGHHTIALSGIGRSGSTRLAFRIGPFADRDYVYQQATGDQLNFILGPGAVYGAASGVDRRNWNFSLSTPTGQHLTAGHLYRTVPIGPPNAPAGWGTLEVDGLDLTYDAHCPGSAYIRELTTGAGDWVTHADVLYQQLCPGSASQSRGELSYAATPASTPIGQHYNALGSYKSKQLGLPSAPETSIAGGQRQLMQLGEILYSPKTGTREVDGAINARYLTTGATAGRLGFPTSDTLQSPYGTGWHTNFSGGSIYYNPTLGAHAVLGPINTTWRSFGAELGRLGYPTSEEVGVAGGRRSTFQHGTISWNKFTNRTTVSYRR